MPTDDPDKLYVKKHKINGLLNDLYTTLTQNKPDDPIEFCIKHFEAKLDPEKKANLERRRSSLASGKPSASEEAPAVISDESKNLNAGRNLLTQLLNKASHAAGDSSKKDEDIKPEPIEQAPADAGINLIAQLNIMV
jgi:hypothetical protein